MKMKMSFLKLAFQHLAHPANAFERCLVFYFVKYYHYYYFEPDSCTITATLATRIPKKKTSNQTNQTNQTSQTNQTNQTKKELPLHLSVHSTWPLTTLSTLLFGSLYTLYTRYTGLGSGCSMGINRLLSLSANICLT
ncbi:hypothetical protein BD560DRAFT_90119 [Blakeslea trispora]|nr:hypothetical protein BD560DRAFT_90119 [Blakeslea trispora]